MPVRTIYFDEAGYTGYNLLDSVQPIFVIASVDIEEQLASEILQSSFPKYQGGEKAYPFDDGGTTSCKALLPEGSRNLVVGACELMAADRSSALGELLQA
jgi:hypothetical protein